MLRDTLLVNKINICERLDTNFMTQFQHPIRALQLARDK